MFHITVEIFKGEEINWLCFGLFCGVRYNGGVFKQVEITASSRSCYSTTWYFCVGWESQLMLFEHKNTGLWYNWSYLLTALSARPVMTWELLVGSKLLKTSYWEAWGCRLLRNTASKKWTEQQADVPGCILPSHFKQNCPAEIKRLHAAFIPMEISGGVLLKNLLGPYGILSLEFLFMLKLLRK